MITINKAFRSVALVATLVLLTAAPTLAQSVLSSTTLSAAITDSQRTFAVASATGITAPAAGATPVLLLVDREVIGVISLSGTTVGVVRGAGGTRAAAHISGASVTVAPAPAIAGYIPGGACVRANLLYVPYIVGGSAGLGTEVGAMYDCLGVTVNGQWVRTDSNDKPTLGSTVASVAGVITPTGTYFKVSGTNAITGILLPAGAQAGFTIAIEPTAIFTWTAATNITVAGTAVVGKVLYFTWNGAKWAPSYIA